MRDEIERRDDAQLVERLTHSYQARERWLDERNDADWLDDGNDIRELPGLGEHLTHLFFGGRIADATRGASAGRISRK
jgi:hypothetical protein